MLVFLISKVKNTGGTRLVLLRVLAAFLLIACWLLDLRVVQPIDKWCTQSVSSYCTLEFNLLLSCFGLTALYVLANTWPWPPARHHFMHRRIQSMSNLSIHGHSWFNSQRKRVAPPPFLSRHIIYLQYSTYVLTITHYLFSIRHFTHASNPFMDERK